MARRDLQNKVFPGGIYNRFNTITLRTTGNATVVHNDRRTGQIGTSGSYDLAVSGFYDPNAIIHRYTPEPPVERSRNDTTKNTDV